MDSLYPYVQRMVIEMDSYALLEAMEFNKGRHFVMTADIKLDIVS